MEQGGVGRPCRATSFYFAGGPPQHETWDPKPDAPAEVHGGQVYSHVGLVEQGKPIRVLS
jgi:hypothetical protein